MTLKWDDAKIKAAIHTAANNGLDAVATVVADRAVGLFGRDHGGVPSKPLHPPNSQTGNLSRSVVRTKAENFKVAVGTAVQYGKHLELGTRKILPRPWLRRALQMSTADAKAAFIAGFRASLRRTGVK